MGVVGYKQTITHINDLPIIKTKILNLSTLYRYRDGTSQNKPDRYYFDITVNGTGLNSAYRHACYFDNEKTAKRKHKELSLKFYDQLSTPFLQKIKSKHLLTLKDKEKILALIDKVDDYKKIGEIILRK